MHLSRALFFRLSTIGSILLVLSACSERKAPVPPTPELPVVDVIQRDQPITHDMIGETRGSSDIPIRARVGGFLESMDFNEGQNVKKGDLLYTIDEIPFQTEVVEAQGKLAEAETMLANAKSDLARIRPLADMNAVSQMDLDAAIATEQAALGSLQTANAQVDQAKILKGYCRIYSPLSGRIGISEVRVGEYVGGDAGNLLNLVSQVDPIRVRFTIDEKNYLRLARKFIDIEPKERANAESKENLTLLLADGSTHKYMGHVVSTNAVVDSMTGTFTLEADFPNPDQLVLAGQFARVRSDIGVKKGALLIPQRSLIELQGGFSVFVVDSQGKIEQRKVVVAQKINRLQIVASGLKAGETVVLEGVQKIRNGMTIKPKLTTFDEVAEPSTVNPKKG